MNQSNDYYIEHFGVKIKNSNLKLERENYAQIDKKVHNKVPQFMIDYYKQHGDSWKNTYEDETCTTYNDLRCKKHREDCLKNFDYNMKYFSSLNEEKFNKALNKIIKIKGFIEVFDLNEFNNESGVYVLVLDEYKQFYIGQSSSIKKRILSHWSKNKEFDKLIFGKVENSILSIDSFRAFDTTRIFVYPTWNTFGVEEKIVKKADARYMLNRTSGGIGSVDTYTDDSKSALVAVAANKKTRDFKI